MVGIIYKESGVQAKGTVACFKIYVEYSFMHNIYIIAINYAL